MGKKTTTITLYCWEKYDVLLKTNRVNSHYYPEVTLIEMHSVVQIAVPVREALNLALIFGVMCSFVM